MRNIIIGLATISTIALVGCGTSATDALYPSGSSTIVTSADHQKVFAVNVHEGTVSLLDPESEAIANVDVGDEPTRIARVGDRLVVTLRGERSIAELDGTTGEVLRVLPTTGPEPFGVVATKDGSLVYVSVSMGGLIEERDGTSLEVLRTFEVGGEPRWMALHPSGRTLVVGHATGSELTSIDLEDGAQATLELPEHETTVPGSVNGTYPLASRVTGDPTFSADGKTLAVPALFVDNTSGEQGTGGVPSFPYYKAAQTTTLGRFNATVVLYKTRANGQPEENAFSTQLVADFASSNGAVVLRSYLSSVTQSPDELAWLVTMEASDAVLLVDATDSATKPLADTNGIAFPNIAVTNTGRGPRGLAVLDDGSVMVHSFLDRSVADIRYDALREEARGEILNGGFPAATPVNAAIGSRLTESVLTPDELDGMNLFYSAADATMGAAGVSCSSCHFDGRTDGVTWKLMNGDRQTPSLAGVVSETAPVTWTNDVETVAAEAEFTAEFRMGTRLADHRSQAIADFVDFVRLPDTVVPDDAEAIARGKTLFEREDVGCAECHSGDRFTDGLHHDLYDLKGVNTPTLSGISATAPYLHDGSALTLRDVLIRSRDGSMGDTSMLSDAELKDLELYLKSL